MSSVDPARASHPDAEPSLPFQAAAPANSPELAFLSAPGELAGLIARFDWSATPLGPITSWPQSLRTTVSLMLNSRHPMWIGWGQDATFLYNDAYIAVLSHAKHPWALGQPAATVWAEIWDVCGPLARQVFEHAQASFVDDVRLYMNRGDFIEETYFSFSYSPVLDETGRVGGLFCPSTEVSAKVLNARRLHTLSTLASSTLQERSFAAACEQAAQVLASNADDLPCGLLYLCQEGGLQLVHALHLAAGTSAAPAKIALEGSGSPWGQSIAAAVQDRVMQVVTVPPDLHWPPGAAGQPIREAVVLPVGLPDMDRPVAMLILGVSPARRLDTEYRTFYELIGRQLAAAFQNARVAQEQQEHAERLAELDRAKTAFFSNISHEFRTPLTLMAGPLEDLLGDTQGALTASQRESLQLMQRNTQRLQKLVNNLLDFSRVQAGRMQAAFAAVDLPGLTADLASNFRSLIESAGLHFEVQCDAVRGPAYVDSSMWEKIVLNLISNAFKFTRTGAIRVVLTEEGNDAVLRVHDTGVGIPANDLSRIFERFHRVEGSWSRTHEGTGIGLALVHDLVDLHHGTITATSQMGSGTTFEVRLPLGHAHLPADQVVAVPSPAAPGLVSVFTSEAQLWLDAEGIRSARRDVLPAASASHGTAGAKVLIVDDNADMRHYLHSILSQRWQVKIASNGRAALEQVMQERPDLIVSDVMMPELDGFGLITRLRQQPQMADLPVILLSARAGEEARTEGMASGADDYLVKPFSAMELVARVDALLHKQMVRSIERMHAARLDRIFRQAPVAIAILRGKDHVYEVANPAYLRLIGGRDVIGLPIRAALPELAGQGIYELLDGVFSTGEPYVGRSLPVNIVATKGGKVQQRFYDFVYQPMDTAGGVVEGIAVVAFDVTDLAQAQRAAEIASRAKDEFMAMLGHELRNPLSPILTALELMRLKGSTELLRERQIIERQTEHMVRLVDDLLDVARIAQGKIALKCQHHEVGKLVALAVEIVSPLLEERQHRLKLQVPSAGVPVHVDEQRFVQILTNLLSNAAKYTDKGGQIVVSAVLDRTDVIIRVEDNGIGIDAALLPAIFDKFVQARQAPDRAIGGLGLGLAIVRNLVELHGGHISATSPGLGKGSVFELRIPVATEIAGPDARSVSPGDHAPANGSRQSVMVVDDIADVRDALTVLLEHGGYTVHSAADAPSALEKIRLVRPALALVDIGLPGMDGYELAAAIRSDPELAGMRLVTLSGYGAEIDRERSRQAGFDAHLVKPVRAQSLFDCLHEVLGREA